MINEKLNKDILDLINENEEKINDNELEINKLKSVLLWTNNNPSNIFNEQTIVINNLSDYKYIDIVYFTFFRDLKQKVHRHYYDTNYNNGEISNSFSYASKGYAGVRSYVVNSNSIHFLDNYDFFSSPSESGMTINKDNGWSIPYKIIGYKE